MRIWVDADACPRAIKAIIFRAAERTQTQTILVANQYLTQPGSAYVQKVQVNAGFDQADQYIVQQVMAGDLVITADLPLADQIVAKAALALNPRGQLYTAANIKAHLAVRNFHTEMRDSGLLSTGPAALDQKNLQRFANALDKLLQAKSRS